MILNSANGLQFTSSLGNASLGALSGGNLLTLSDMAGSPIALSIGGNGASTSFIGSILGNGSLTKVGSGTMVIAGSSTFNGGVTISGGALSVNSLSTGGTSASAWAKDRATPRAKRLSSTEEC